MKRGAHSIKLAVTSSIGTIRRSYFAGIGSGCIDFMLSQIKRGSHSLTISLLVMFVIGAGAVTMAKPAWAQTQTPTAEQLRQFESLSPVQRAMLLDALGEQRTITNQAPLVDPTVVTPRRVAQPTLTSTEVREGQGIEGLTDSAAKERPRSELRAFGYDLFAGEPTTFAPATDIPVPVDYVIGPGDNIEVQLFGSQNASYSLVVTREGVLNFPELGPITVSGLRFNDLRSTLQQRVSDQMIGVRASITMGRLRSIRIFILGDAYRPGSYTISALSTMTNALFVSGGINTIGSLRNIQLKRSGQVVTTLDLYDLLLEGDTSGDSRLQPGDVIFIPPVGKTVGVDGEVRRPAIYELKNERSVKDLLALAGGLLPTAFPQASQIERISERRERTIIDVDLSSAAGLATNVESDDVIRVYSVLEKREDIVLLSGEVYRDGAFQWHPGMRLTDLIASLKDLQPEADPSYILIRRETPDSLQIEVLSADLNAALGAPGSAADVLLSPRDQVRIFNLDASRSSIVQPLIAELRLQSSQSEPTRVVSVSGRVRAPGQYPLETGMHVSDLIRAGGGLAEAAYAYEAELTRHSLGTGDERQTELININLARILEGDAAADLTLAPHDLLSIKEIPQWRELESVSIQGEIRFPGTYSIRHGARLSSVIARAGNLTDIAFAHGAVFLRSELRRREQQQLNELAQRLQSEVAVAAASTTDEPQSAAARQALLDQLNATVATGRLVIDLPLILSGPTSDHADVVLEHGDRLLIPHQSQTVTIIGEVQFPTSHIYMADISRNQYIDKSGGTTQNADKKRIYIVRADGAVIINTGSLFFRKTDISDIRPGDTIVVPFDADHMNRLTLWTNVTTVIYNLAVAAAAVASF